MEKQMLKQIIERYESATFSVNRIMDALVRERMPENLTTDQLYIMRYIRDRETCTSSELAEVFHVGKSSITAIIKRLADKELIKRMIDEKDRRFTYLSLTPEGERIAGEMTDMIEDLLAKYMTHINDGEAIAFIETLEKLARLLVEEEGGHAKV